MTELSWYERVPKVELHIHLEGAIPLDALWTLVQKYDGTSLVPDLAALQAKFVYRDFPHFIETWIWKNQFLRAYEDFTFIAEAVACDLAAQNIRYVEMYCSPTDFRRRLPDVQRIAQAIRKGLDRVPQIHVALVPDLVRDMGPERGMTTLAQLNEVRACGIIGITIGGSEQLYPPEPFAPVFEEARRLGWRTSAHAGEAAGAASVWGAVRALKVDRVGHGTRAVEDEALLDHLAEMRIPIELCPISNVRTSVIASIAQHPARHFFERGMLLSINTDDPKMFGNRLADEYRTLEEQLGFTRDEIRALILQGIESSWLTPDCKRQLAAEFRADPNWLR
ncbi:MAG: adenosine deaminase [Chloroflexi bacterium]|nr:adenosine deaminase [Chloroflexota bacterium]